MRLQTRSLCAHDIAGRVRRDVGHRLTGVWTMGHSAVVRSQCLNIPLIPNLLGGVQIAVELPRPLGIVFAEKKNGDIRVDELVEGGNAKRSGIVKQVKRVDDTAWR